MVELPLPQHTDLGRVIYANSITLTPGTVSVRLAHDTIMVHALAKQTAEVLRSGQLASVIPEDRASGNKKE
jgi:multicomponent Na+:H+ antiporter subunit E